MCFYYAITKKNPEPLVEQEILKVLQLELFTDHFLVNGFEHPAMPVVTNAEPGQISWYRWGMVPETVRNESEAARFLARYNTLNAHADRLFDSHLFGQAIRSRRCLVLCSGFFEWRQIKGKKIPYFISLSNDALFAFAGIWNSWNDQQGRANGTYSVITVEANELMAQIHNTRKRMPLILRPEQAKRWIAPNLNEDEIRKLIRPLASQHLKAHTVGHFLHLSPGEKQQPQIIAYYGYPGIADVMATWKQGDNPDETQTVLDFQ